MSKSNGRKSALCKQHPPSGQHHWQCSGKFPLCASWVMRLVDQSLRPLTFYSLQMSLLASPEPKGARHCSSADRTSTEPRRKPRRSRKVFRLPSSAPSTMLCTRESTTGSESASTSSAALLPPSIPESRKKYLPSCGRMVLLRNARRPRLSAPTPNTCLSWPIAMSRASAVSATIRAPAVTRYAHLDSKDCVVANHCWIVRQLRQPSRPYGAGKGRLRRAGDQGDWLAHKPSLQASRHSPGEAQDQAPLHSSGRFARRDPAMAPEGGGRLEFQLRCYHTLLDRSGPEAPRHYPRSQVGCIKYVG